MEIMGHPGNFRYNQEKSIKNRRTHIKSPILEEIIEDFP